MSTYWSTHLKPLVKKRLELSGIKKDSESYQLILKLEKSINTCWNMLNNGISFEKLQYSKPFETASECFDLLNNNGIFDYNEAKYYLDWEKYCKYTGICPYGNIYDFLA